MFQEGQGDPLVFLHGELGHLRPDEDEFLQLLSRKFTVYAPQQPGYGESEGLEAMYDVQDLALYYMDLLESLELDRPALAGQSLGGMVAAEMATLCPHVARKLVLITPLGLWRDELPVPDAFTMGREELRSRLFSDPGSPAALQALPDRFPSPEREMAFWHGLSAAGKLIWGLPYGLKLERRLYRISAPTLILWGQRDGLVAPQHGEVFRRGIKDARLETLDGCAHAPHLEAPREVADMVEGFLAQGQ